MLRQRTRPNELCLLAIARCVALGGVLLGGGWAFAVDVQWATPDPDGRTRRQFGHSVAVDGEWGVVGVPAGAGLCYSGEVQVYRRVGDVWERAATLRPDAAVPDERFGFDVAIGDGWIVVGAPRATTEDRITGAVYFYRLDLGADEWAMTGRHVPRDSEADDFVGSAVALSDGVALVAARGTDRIDGGSVEVDAGAVHVYELAPGEDGWQWQQSLEPVTPLQAGDGLGQAVALVGGVAAVGVQDAGELGRGSVHIFDRDPLSGQWEWSDTLDSGLGGTSGPSLDLGFGRAIAMFENTLIVGAPRAAAIGSDPNLGAVWIFRRDAAGLPFTGRQVLRPQTTSAEEMGTVVSLVDERLLIGGETVPGLGGGLIDVYRWSASGSMWVADRQVAGPGFDDRWVGDRFGFSVAQSNGEIWIGAPDHDGPGDRSGAVFVYEESPVGVLSLAAQLAPESDGPAGDQYGVSIHLHGDLAVVGARLDDSLRPDGGQATVFRRDPEGIWLTEGILVPSSPRAGQRFGIEFAFEEGLIVVGSGESDLSGSVSVFELDVPSGEWQETHWLSPPDPQPSAEFGISLAVEGEWLVVAAPFADGSTESEGRVFIYRRVGTEWELHQELTAIDPQPRDRFGRQVALGGDLLAGDILWVGADGDDTAAIDGGAVHVYRYEPAMDTWEFSQKILSSVPASGGRFGRTVTLSSDGQRGAVGAPSQFIFPSEPGTVELFTRAASGSGSWSSLRVLTPGSMSSELMGPLGAQPGWGVGDSIDLVGDFLLVGAPKHPGGGRAFLYRWDGTDVALLESLVVADTDRFGFDVAVEVGSDSSGLTDGWTALVGAPGDDRACVNEVCDDCDAGAIFWIEGAAGLVRFRRGDVNGDGVVDLGDAIGTLGALFGGVATGCSDSLDANDDGSLDVADAVFLLSYLFSSGSSPSAPFLDCDIDPTEDTLPCVAGPGC